MPVRLAYVVGAGRSGSTILDIVLGNHPAAASLGELRQLDRVLSGDEFCSCGEAVAGCPFWSAVLARWRREGGPENLEDYERLRGRYERLRSVPRLWFESRWRRPAFRRYAAWTVALLGAIRTEAGRDLVVDSSKNPARALALSRMSGVDLRLVHLVRDGRGVTWSYAKSFARDKRAGIEQELKPIPVWRTALAWTLANVAAGWVGRRIRRDAYLVLRYEDLVGETQASLTKLGGHLDLNTAELAAGLAGSGEREDARELAVGHMLAGNMVRMKGGGLRLRPDFAWREKLPERDRRTFWRIAGWLMRRYGYAR